MRERATLCLAKLLCGDSRGARRTVKLEHHKLILQDKVLQDRRDPFLLLPGVCDGRRQKASHSAASGGGAGGRKRAQTLVIIGTHQPTRARSSPPSQRSMRPAAQRQSEAAWTLRSKGCCASLLSLPRNQRRCTALAGTGSDAGSLDTRSSVSRGSMMDLLANSAVLRGSTCASTLVLGAPRWWLHSRCLPGRRWATTSAGRNESLPPQSEHRSFARCLAVVST